MLTRRDFMKISGLSAGFLLSNPFNIAFSKNKNNDFHLLFEPGDIPELKRHLESPLFKTFWEEQLNADIHDDRKFMEQEVEYNNQLRHLDRVDRTLQREAFIYAITKDKTRGELARLAVQTILKFKKWDYFLEAGKDVISLQRGSLTTQALVMAYDWISDLLTEDEKSEIIKQLPEKGCEPCYRSLYGMLHKEEVVGWGFDPESSFYEERDMRKWPWILSRTNLRAVPMSALGLGAIFLKGRDSRVERWMDIVRQTYEDFVDLFEPDGSYPEGTGYCRYTSEEVILFLDALQRHTAEDWSGAINWQGVMDFLIVTLMPTTQHPEGHVNFGDGGSGFGSDVAFWIANKYQNRSIQYAAKHLSANHKIWSVAWFNPKLEEEMPPKKVEFRHFDIGWVVVSTGIMPEDFVVAMRSGGPANHEHADRNSIILKSYSENLLVDNWHPPYSHEHAAWTLRTSPAHNTVLIDGKGHQYHNGLEGTNSSLAEAKVIKKVISDKYFIVSSDATQAYQLVNDNVRRVNRTFLTVPELKILVVIDDLLTIKNDATFAARWFVDNEDKNGRIEIQDNKFTFYRPLAKLIGCCGSSHGIKLSQHNFPVPEEHGIYPYLDVTAEKAGTRVCLISAMAAYKNEDMAPIVNLDRAGNHWLVIFNIDGKEFKANINNELIIPEITVQYN